MTDAAPAGTALLERLRGVGAERPPIDPDVQRYLGEVLDEAVAAVGQVPPEVTVRVSKGRVRQVLLCERYLVASMEEGGGAPSRELVIGQLLDRVFALVVVGHPVSDDPFGDAMVAAAVAGDDGIIDAFEALAEDDRLEVRAQVTELARALAGRWPRLPGNAFPRLQEPLRAELAGGRVVLSGRVDVALGGPGIDRAGTTLVDVKSGRRRYDDALDADWYAVLESLRHGVPPFQSGSYYLRDGGLDLTVYDPARLAVAVERVGDAVSRLVALAAGQPPSVTPNGLCPWCPAFASCPPGRAFAADQGVDTATWDEDDSG